MVLQDHNRGTGIDRLDWQNLKWIWIANVSMNLACVWGGVCVCVFQTGTSKSNLFQLPVFAL